MRDLRECIPETVPRRTLPERATSRSARASHYVLPYRDVVSNRFLNVNVAPCDFLRLESCMPVILIADGERIIPDPELDLNSIFAPNWDATAGGDEAVHLRPGISLTLEREIRNISVLGRYSEGVVNYSDPIVLDLDQIQVPGAVHLFIGSGAARNVGFGLPYHHVVRRSIAGVGATSADIGPIRPTLHGDNVQSANGVRWVPSVTFVTGVTVDIQWSAVAGNITLLVLRQLAPGPANIELRSYSLNDALPHRVEFERPVRIENYVTRRNFDDRGALEVRIGASQSIANAVVTLDCESYF